VRLFYFQSHVSDYRQFVADRGVRSLMVALRSVRRLQVGP
jgi:hypothetical protein